MEIVGGAHAEHQGCFQPVQIAVHETFLPGCADAHPDDVRLESAYASDQLSFLTQRKVPIGWSPCADDTRPGILLCESTTKFFGHTFLAAIEKVRIRSEVFAPKDLSHQIGSGN